MGEWARARPRIAVVVRFRPRRLVLAAAFALVAAAPIAMALAGPANADAPSTFLRVDSGPLPNSSLVFAPPDTQIGAKLHLSSGPTDRGYLTVGILQPDGTFGPYLVTVQAAVGSDIVVGHLYRNLASMALPPDPAVPAGSCDGLNAVVQALATAEDGSVTTLALAASCPNVGYAWQARINSDLPFAAYAIDRTGQYASYPGGAQTKTITVHSTGTEPLVVSGLEVADLPWDGHHPAQSPSLSYAVTSETCTAAPVDPGSTCEIQLTYDPPAVDPYGIATVSATANTFDGAFATMVYGSSADPMVWPPGWYRQFDPGMVAVPSAPMHFDIGVIGGGPRTFGPLEITGVAAADFAITGDTCTPAPVPAGTTCGIDVTYTPSGSLDTQAALVIHGDAVVGQKRYMMSGTGVSPISVPAKLEFGYSQPGGRYVKSVTITSLASVPIRLKAPVREVGWDWPNPDRITMDSETCSHAPIPAHGTCSITFAFEPAADAPADAKSQVMFLIDGSGWSDGGQVVVTGIARPPDPGAQTHPAPVIHVDAMQASWTEGEGVFITGTYSDPRGLAVTMQGGAYEYDGLGWGESPSGRWAWAGVAPNGPSTLDITLTASDVDATSPPLQLHLVITNAAPMGTISTGPAIVPVTGDPRTYRLWVFDVGNDIATITPTCGPGTVVSLTPVFLTCSFTTPGSGMVGVTVVDTAGARVDVLTPVTATGQDRAHGDTDISVSTAGSRLSSGAVALVDLNGDGRKEVVTDAGTAAGRGTVAVLDQMPATGSKLSDQAVSPLGYTITGPTGSRDFGTVIASAGDVNGDGVEDLLVGAPSTSVDGRVNTGSAFVIYGGRPAVDLDMDDLDPSIGLRIDGAHAASTLGTSLAGGGDVNGDGYGDIVVGAEGERVTPNPTSTEGAAYVVFGAAASSNLDLSAPADGRWASLVMAGGSDHALYGAGLAIGDVDGDGLADVVSGGSYNDEAVFVTWGSRTFTSHVMGNGTDPAWARLGDSRPPTWTSPSWAIGTHLAVADVDGDGTPDIVAGYQSVTTTLATVFFGSHDRHVARQSYLSATRGGGGWGTAAVAGDIDGDGHADIGVRGADGVLPYSIVIGGGQAIGTVPVDSPDRGWLRLDDVPDPPVPMALGMALGDINGDGLADLVVRDGASIEVVLGHAARLAPTVLPPVVGLVTGTVSSVSVPVRVSWHAYDGGSGVRDFTVSVRRDGGSLAMVGLVQTRAIRATATPKHRYQWVVRARDWAGNSSPRVSTVAFPIDLVAETSRTIHWVGRWSTRTNTHLLGGHERGSTTKGASATFTFTGRSIGWVAAVGRDGGSAIVYIDGVRTATVSLHGSTSYRRLVFSQTWATAGVHTIRIVVVGTKGHARVDVDAIAVIR